jgi:hypothetical protein
MMGLPSLGFVALVSPIKLLQGVNSEFIIDLDADD